MHKILVIDDDVTRNEKIVEKLKSAYNDITIHSADSYNSARKKLNNNYYFAVFLDMALPIRSLEKKLDLNAGIKLLDAIARGRFKKIPSRVIGFTALIDNREEKEESFENLGFRLYEAKRGDFSWLGKALVQIDYSLKSIESYNQLPTDIAIVSIHGIETNGKWQEKIHSLIKDKYSDVDVSNLQFKFESFPITRFLIPFLRDKMVKRFQDDLERWINNNETKRIVCFAHSFGTYILVKALEELKKKYDLENLDLIILAGSVLKQNYDFSDIKSLPNLRLVNECAKQDGALLFSKAAVWGTGMGGRLGFSSLLDAKFSNRSYPGGHSVFFNNDCEIVKNYWLPLLDTNNELKPFNISSRERKRDKVFEYIARFSSKLKVLYYLLAITIFIIPLVIVINIFL